jgi:uncharacterized phage protein (predicted DNA packaging)
MTLEEVKTLLQITDTSQDTLINTLIPIAEDYVKQYTNNFSDDEFPPAVKLVIAQIVSFHLVAKDTSIASEKVGGISYTYRDNYPDSVYKTLNTYRKLRW